MPTAEMGPRSGRNQAVEPSLKGVQGSGRYPLPVGAWVPLQGPMEPLVIGCWCIHEIVVDACSRRAQWRFMC
jgi:hypothetical protein